MTDEVAHLVLRNNYLQSLAISLTSRKGTANGRELGRLMDVLAAAGQLNRKVELLPDEAGFAERYAAGKPLTRPEIGVLLSYAKLVLFDQLVASDLPDEPAFASVLAGYFPKAAVERFPGALEQHRLKREIVSTALSNRLVNLAGPVFVARMKEMSGAPGA